MTKEHKKLYKAGKNWIVATLTATTITLLGGIGAYTVHADTTIESSQDVQTTSVNQTNQVDNSNNSVTINQPVAVQSSQTAQNDLSVQGNQTNQTVPSSATAAADTSNSDSLDSNIYGTVQSSQNNNSNNSVVLNQPVTTQSNSTVKNSQPVQNTPTTLTVTAATNNSSKLDPNIYGTVNVKDWDYQTENNILNITGYHGSDKMHMTIPNLNDFAKSGLNIDNVNCVGLSSAVAKDLASHKSELEYGQDKIGRYVYPSLAISKTSGRYSDKVIATDSDWSGAFSNCYLSHADLTNLDTSNITNMSQMFAFTGFLKSLKGLDNWDTSKVTDMSKMFEDACELETLNLSNWNTSNVTNMANMFLNDESLTSIGDLSHWNTSNVTNMANMFAYTTSLTSIGDLSHWDTHNVTDMSCMFSVTSPQTVGDLSHWDTHNVTNMSDMFGGSKFKTLNLTNWNTSKVTDMSNMFNMFPNTSSLTSIGDLSHWDTHNVTNMQGMFEDLISPTIGNIGNWNTSKVTDMSYMFKGCNPQTGIDLSHWDTHNVTNMSDMFEGSKFKTLNLTNWNTSKVTDMSEMFKDASNLQTVGDLSNWDISKVTKMPRMFENASSLQSVGNLSKWKTDSLIDPDVFLIDFPVRDMFSYTHLPYFYTSNRQDDGYYRNDGYYKNQVRLIDQKGLMGQPGTTVAIIDTPTFYQQLNGKSKEDSVVATITPLVEKEANKIYQQFRSNLPKGMQLIYPDKVSLKMIYSDDIDDLANAIFVFNMNKNVVINYVDQDGKVIKTDTISDKVGDQINVKLSLPDGYELANKDEQIPSSITVGEDGIKPITIQVKKLPVVQTGSINYVDQDGKVIKTDTISGKVGDQINVKLSLPDGYELANKDEQVPSTITVGDDGIKTIIINIKKIPVTKTGTINYIDPDGKVVKTDQVSGKVGDKVDVKLSLPDGYELANKDEQIPSTVTVTEDGISPISVNIKKINTTLADNEVPYDSTTISNNVNANYGYLDSYKLTENNQGQAQLIASGWHATGASNSDRYRYMIVFDNTLGHEIARQKLVPQVRSDVQRAYSNVDNSLYSGFNVTIDIPNSCINHSLRLVSRYSNDPNHGEGARVDYWFNSLALNEDNQAYLDKLSANGDTLTVTGWHATNQAAGRPYHYIIAWDRNLGHEIARQKVTAVSRPDVANAYSTVANAVNSGFSVNFNLTPQFFNDNIQFISRWTDDAAGNGNAVDYWFKPMNRTNRANLDSVTLSNGQVKVAGWHATDLSQLEPNHYLIVFDNTTGQQVASEKVDLQSSQDVKNVFGDIQTADHSRFNYTFNSLHLIPGHNYSLVSRYSADATGNGNDGAHTDSWLNMGTFQQSAYSIDHVALNRRHMTVQGWVANDNAMTRPYAYAILLQNGHEIGRQRLNLSERADVAKVYPQIYRSQYSGFNTSFDLPTASTNGLQLVLRFTDDPAGNGNSSDKWINL